MNDIKHTILRFAFVFTMIFLLFVVVAIRVVKIQTVERNLWLKVVEQREQYTRAIQAVRGDIYDCKGRLLATNVPKYNVFMETSVEALHLDDGELFWQNVDTIAAGLSRIIGDKTKEEYRLCMEAAYNGKSKSEQDIYLSKEVISEKQWKEISSLPLVNRGKLKSGIYEVPLNARLKPFNSLGGRTIGDMALKDSNQLTGLECRFDSCLRGRKGTSVRKFVAGAWQYIPVDEGEKGCDVYTTLDADLMDICETTLRDRLEQTEAEWGCVVLMEVATGEIKSMNNLKRGSDGEYYETANYSVLRGDPGSTFKTISMMAALDDGKIDEHTLTHVTKESWRYYGLPHTDSHKADADYTPRQALAVSSNIALAKIVAQNYDAASFIDKVKQMGLCDNIDYTIPGAQQPRLRHPNKGDKATIAKMAYGYSVELSPLHILMFYNGIANNGKLITPLFVNEIRKNGEVVETFQSSVVREHMCSDAALRVIKDGLHDVVWDNTLGTASQSVGKINAQSDIVEIAGKTGTAQILQKRGERSIYSNKRHRISFVGYFPEENPKYSCICVIYSPKPGTSNGSGVCCGGAVREIAEKIMIQEGEYVIENGEKVLVLNK